jgi:hypothetical protein
MLIGQKPYAKLNKKASWLTTLLTGSKPHKSPLARLETFDMIRGRVRAAMVARSATVSEPSTAGVPNAIADLGLDTPEENGDALAGIIQSEGALEGSTKRRRRCALVPELVDVPLTIDVPVIPNSTDMQPLEVLGKTERDGAWIHLTRESLMWLRHYVLEELGVRGPDTPPKEARPRTSLQKNIYWCWAAGVWRINYRNKAGEMITTSVSVARMPAHNYKARVSEAQATAVELFKRHHHSTDAACPSA